MSAAAIMHQTMTHTESCLGAHARCHFSQDCFVLREGYPKRPLTFTNSRPSAHQTEEGGGREKKEEKLQECLISVEKVGHFGDGETAWRAGPATDKGAKAFG